MSGQKNNESSRERTGLMGRIQDSPRRGLFRRLSSNGKLRNSAGGGGGAVPTKSVNVRSSAQKQSPRTSFSVKRSSKTTAGGEENNGSSSNLLEEADEDPVMALFQERSRQRVRFCIEGEEHEKESKESSNKKERPSSPPLSASSDDKHAFNIKTFMNRTLFKNGSTPNAAESENAAEVEARKEIDSSPFIWESPELDIGGVSPEVVHTTAEATRKGDIKVSFTENLDVRNQVLKMLDKGRRAQFSHFRYEYAVKTYMKALNLLTQNGYPDQHPLLDKTLKALNNAHHSSSSFKNSATIVKMGIKYEESQELIRALKMYTIAYRIRRDQLSRYHPSLVVLLNILGSIQIKRNDLKEAMQIFELALKDAPTPYRETEENLHLPTPPINLLARAVTFREMGLIHEKWGDATKALHMYHMSLDCISDWKDKNGSKRGKSTGKAQLKAPTSSQPNIMPLGSVDSNDSSGNILDDLKMCKTFRLHKGSMETEDMEVYLGSSSNADEVGLSGDKSVTDFYNSFFRPDDVAESHVARRRRKFKPSSKESYADVDIALTLHQIGQMHRSHGKYGHALDAYKAALRGMKCALGDVHPNVAAILANIGNLHKESGNLDAAYDTYQEVLGIESYRLGVSHPEVAISLHNVATIEAARGNYAHALSIYQKVIYLQRKLFGEEHASVSVTAACMGDVHESLGDLKCAMESYEEALAIKTSVMGRHHLEVARVLHKLGKLAFARKECGLADSYVTRAVLIYRLNRLSVDHEWVFDANRDSADIDAFLAVQQSESCEV